MTTTLTLGEAEEFLNKYHRWSLSDSTFGGTEVGWTDDDGKNVAIGWFERSPNRGDEAQVRMDQSHPLNKEIDFDFKDDDAQRLRRCGKSASFAMNDIDDGYSDEATVASDPGLVDDSAYQEFLRKRP